MGGEDGNTDRWDEEQELIKLYGLTDAEATVFVANLRLKRDEAMEFLGIERQTFKNILSSANKKLKRSETMQIFNIIRPMDKSKETQHAVEILARFYANTPNVTGRYGTHTITLTHDPQLKGDTAWMETNIFNVIPITDVSTPTGISGKVLLLTQEYNERAEGEPMMGWGVLKRKLDQMYVKNEIV